LADYNAGMPRLEVMMKLLEWKPTAKYQIKKSIQSVLLVLGVPREIIYAKCHKQTVSIYNRMSKLDIWHLGLEYGALEMQKCTTRYCGYCNQERASQLIEARKRLAHLLKYRPTEGIPWGEIWSG
jgi:hypothetical protein